MTSFNGWGNSWGNAWGQDEPGSMLGSASFSISATGDLVGIEQAIRNGGAPAWNPYEKRIETDEQKRTRRLAQGIIKQAQKPLADVEKLANKAKEISRKLQRDAEAYELEARQLSIELARAYDARLKAAAMNALNDALATRQLEQQLVIAQVHAEMVRQQIEELDVVFMAVMLAAL